MIIRNLVEENSSKDVCGRLLSSLPLSPPFQGSSDTTCQSASQSDTKYISHNISSISDKISSHTPDHSPSKDAEHSISSMETSHASFPLSQSKVCDSSRHDFNSSMYGRATSPTPPQTLITGGAVKLVSVAPTTCAGIERMGVSTVAELPMETSNHIDSQRRQQGREINNTKSHEKEKKTEKENGIEKEKERDKEKEKEKLPFMFLW